MAEPKSVQQKRVIHASRLVGENTEVVRRRPNHLLVATLCSSAGVFKQRLGRQADVFRLPSCVQCLAGGVTISLSSGFAVEEILGRCAHSRNFGQVRRLKSCIAKKLIKYRNGGFGL